MQIKELTRLEKALSSFEGNCNCAQSVLCSFSTDYGLDEDKALKIASGFGGGMGRLGRTCGAVTGAFMVIGLKYGMGIEGSLEAKEKTYQVIQNFSNQFQELFGSIICKELLNCDINTSEGRNLYDQRNYFEEKCRKYVKKSVEILEELMQ